MNTQALKSKNGQMVNNYFKFISDLRKGEESSVEKLMSFWHPEGVFEFAGTPPVIGTFKGAMAIQALYKNRLKSSGMKVNLDMGKQKLREVSLGIVETEVTHVREKDNHVIAGWRTTIGTEDGKGFDVAGSHMFTIEDGKIKTLRVNISPKADASQLKSLSVSDLSVQDIGRLSLAAWPVV